ncbi:hypothetical protein [Sphingobacterium faecium]|uniref:NACHT domain-containing protein n=1 Tax=Sphingobacterium faecium TaxID=34087 RepID=UPI0032091338
MKKVIIAETALSKLPIYEVLDWEMFQTFSQDVLGLQEKVIESRDYLSRGSKQDGIDVYAIEAKTSKKVVIQCKLVESLGPKQIIDIVDLFLEGKFVSDTKRFIICTNQNLGKTERQESILEQVRQKLRVYDIDLEIWDEGGISVIFRKFSHVSSYIALVHRYFGSEVAIAFYGNIWSDYILSLNKIPKKDYAVNLELVDRTVSSHNSLEEIKSISLLSLLNNNRITNQGKRIALLSMAGYGKSSELSQLSATCSSTDCFLYPVLFILRDYNGQSISDILFEIIGQNWGNIEKHRLLLVLDGLDEIIEDYFQPFINSLNSFLQDNSEVNVVISSRFNFLAPGEHSQIRGFDFYTLDELTSSDIESFLIKSLGQKLNLFRTEIKRIGFSDYIGNPFYLSRLLKIQKQILVGKRDDFPKTKGELLKDILFERLQEEGIRYRDNSLIDVLFQLAKKVAFSMTTMSWTYFPDTELKKIIPKVEGRNNFSKFCAVSKRMTKNASWSFEHRNIQEYLTAEALAVSTIDKIINAITIDGQKTKIASRFLNTVSLLFEILEPQSTLFTQLLDWLIKNEPEALIRFERDRLTKEKRQSIFKKIWYNYKDVKCLPFRVSEQLNLEQLATFVEVDANVVQFLLQELSGTLQGDHAYDALHLIGKMNKPYIVKDIVRSTLLKFLADDIYDDFIKGEIISVFLNLGITDRVDFQNILSHLKIGTGFYIRKASIKLLNGTNYYNEYADYIIESIIVFEEGQKEVVHGGVNEFLRKLISRFDTKTSIVKTLHYLINNPKRVKTPSSKGFQFEERHIAKILENAVIYKDELIVLLVYKLFRKIAFKWSNKNLISVFAIFFKEVNISQRIFTSLYKWNPDVIVLSHFLDKDNCDFLVKEYLDKHIASNQLRNYLYWSTINNKEISFYFDNLVNQFAVEIMADDDIYFPDHVRIKEYIETKNIEILLDKKSLFAEIQVLFSLDQATKIEDNDLYQGKLSHYSDSFAYKAIQKYISYNEPGRTFGGICKLYTNQEWEWFRIECIIELLEDQNKKSVLDARLLDFIENWCTNKVATLDFTKTYTDNHDGSFSVQEEQSIVLRVVQLLNLKLSDHLWLKLLVADHSGFFDEEGSLSLMVSSGVNDKGLLKTTIIENIRQGALTRYVLYSHIKLCVDLGFIEILPDIFTLITTGLNVSDLDRIELTKHYVKLGGESSDFLHFLVLQENKDRWSFKISWGWYLVQELRTDFPDNVKVLLINYFDKSEESFSKMVVAQELISFGYIDAFCYWHDCFLNKGISFIGDDWGTVSEGLKLLPKDIVQNLLLEALVKSYKRKLYLERFDTGHINEVIFGWLQILSENDEIFFLEVSEKVISLVASFEDEKAAHSLRFRHERFSQAFYSTKTKGFSLKRSIELYQSLT